MRMTLIYLSVLFVGSNLLCTTDAALNDDCTVGDGNCTTPDNSVCNETSAICVCDTGYTASSDNSICGLNVDNDGPSLTCPDYIEIIVQEGVTSIDILPTYNGQIVSSENDLVVSPSTVSVGINKIGQHDRITVKATNDLGLTKSCNFLVTYPGLDYCDPRVIYPDPNRNTLTVTDDWNGGLTALVTCRTGYTYRDGSHSKEFTCTPGFLIGWVYDPEDVFCLAYQYPNFGFSLNVQFVLEAYAPQCHDAFDTLLVNNLARFESNVQGSSDCASTSWDITGGRVNSDFNTITTTLLFSLANLNVPSNQRALCRQQIIDNYDQVFSFPNPGRINCPAGLVSITPSGVAEDALPALFCGAASYDLVTSQHYGSICIPCGPGSFYDEIAGSCSQCPIYSYSTMSNRFACVICPGGAVATAVRIECQDICPEGYFSVSGMFPCTPCPEDFYWVDSKTCQPCPYDGSTRGQEGATTLAACSVCGAITDFADGTVTYSNIYLFGSDATFTCNAGFSISATLIRTCQAGGSWSSTNPTCSRISCGAITDFADGSVTYSDNYLFESDATFTCNAGFTISATVTRTCQAGGSWSLTTPTCSRISCGPLTDPAGGMVTYSSGYLYESVATFSCSTGYTLSGAETRLCGANGFWESQSPFCVLNGVGLGGDCVNDGSCVTSNSECSVNTVCICKSTHRQSTGGSACEAKLGVGCSTASDCYDSQAVCPSGSRVCECNNAHYDDNKRDVQGGTCTPKVLLDNTCPTNIPVTESCSDINALCTGGICVCISTYYHERAIAGAVCRPMTDLRVNRPETSNPQLTSFTVTWEDPTGKSEHVSGYTVQWRPTDNSVAGDAADAGKATSYVITDISPGKAYTVSVISRNEVTQQNSPRTITSLPREQAAKPNLPGNLILGSSNLDAGSQNINLVWSSPAAGSFTGYRVKMFEGAAELYSKTFYTTQGLVYFSTMLHGHRYNVSITTLSEQFDNGKTVDSDTDVEEIKTIVKAPTRPRNVRCIEVFDLYITLQWDEPTLLNGEDAQYHVTATDLSNTVITKIIASTITANVQGLSPGSSYMFEVIVENEMYNSSIASTPSFCKTSAKMSDPPTSLQASGVTSRSFDVSWSDPVNTYSAENLGYVLQIKDSDGVCVKEEIYVCTGCTGLLQVGTLTDLCSGNPSVINKAKSDLSGTQTFSATGYINPDIVYDVTVTAVNDAGRGHKATINVTTLEETPAKPAIVSITGVTATSFTVTWSIAGPRPGQTVYTIDATAAAPAPNRIVNVPDADFNIRSREVTGLEEFWVYTVTVTATTGVGSTASDVSSSVTTDFNFPGQVSNFNVDRTLGGRYNVWEVTWMIPAILDRNSEIIGYRITHNGTNAVTLKEIDAEAREDFIYTETVVVVPENFYSVEVFAVNSLDQIGTPTTYSTESLAGVPKPPQQANFQAIQAPSPSRKTIKITIDRDFLLLNTAGTIRATGLLCCAQAKCEHGLNALSLTEEAVGYKSMRLNDFRAADTWYIARQNGFSLYRPTKDGWVEDFDAQSDGAGRRRRAAEEDITYTIGDEQCTSEDPALYCNGPLVESTSFLVYVVVCTNGGCLISPEAGPYATLAGTDSVSDETNTTVIAVGVTLGVVIVLLVAVVIFLLLRNGKRKNTGNDKMKATADRSLADLQSDNGLTHQNQPPEQQSSDYTALEDFTRDDKSTYDSIAQETVAAPDSLDRRPGYHTYQNV